MEIDETRRDGTDDKQNQDDSAEFSEAGFKEDYWDEITRQSEENQTRYVATHKYFVDRILGLFLDGTSINLLDVGCGFGFFVSYACKAGIHGSGIDTSERATMFARNQLDLNNIFCTSLASHAKTNRSYNVVTAFNLLEHVNIGTVKDMYRLVEPGGFLLIRIPNAAFHRVFHRVIRLFGLERKVPHSVLATEPPKHLYGFSKKNVNILLVNAGFTEIQICPSPLQDARNPLNYRSLVSLVSRYVYLVSRKKVSISPSIYILAKKPT